MRGMRRRVRRLEKCAVLDAAAVREASELVAAEALKRVSNEDLDAMAEMLERRPDATGSEEAAIVLREEHPEVWGRYEEIWREVAEEMARGG